MTKETENLTTQGIQIKVVSKVCGKCKRKLPSKDFWGSRSSKDGLQGACKDCQCTSNPKPLGTRTTDLTKLVTVKTEPVHKEPIKVGGPVYQKRVRPSRAHPIGSGKRKECKTCMYVIVGTITQCSSAAAINDGINCNPAEPCKYREETKTNFMGGIK